MNAEAEARKIGIGALFDRASETYDTVGPRFFTHFGRRLVDLTPLKPGSTVLDVAAGRGAVLFPASQKIGPSGQLTAVDLAEGMVQRTAAQLASTGITNARLIQMDAENLDFPDASFDFVLCGFGLFFFPQLSQALTEIYRVLKPGGMLAASIWGKADERWNWIAEVGLRPKPQTGNSARRPVHDNNTTWLETALNQAHFGDYHQVKEEADMTFASPDEWWASEWSHGARGCLERMETEALAQAKTAAYLKLEEMRQPDGIHHIYRVIFNFASKPAE